MTIEVYFHAIPVDTSFVHSSKVYTKTGEESAKNADDEDVLFEVHWGAIITKAQFAKFELTDVDTREHKAMKVEYLNQKCDEDGACPEGGAVMVTAGIRMGPINWWDGDGDHFVLISDERRDGEVKSTRIKMTRSQFDRFLECKDIHNLNASEVVETE